MLYDSQHYWLKHVDHFLGRAIQWCRVVGAELLAGPTDLTTSTEMRFFWLVDINDEV